MSAIRQVRESNSDLFYRFTVKITVWRLSKAEASASSSGLEMETFSAIFRLMVLAEGRSQKRPGPMFTTDFLGACSDPCGE